MSTVFHTLHRVFLLYYLTRLLLNFVLATVFNTLTQGSVNDIRVSMQAPTVCCDTNVSRPTKLAEATAEESRATAATLKFEVPS